MFRNMYLPAPSAHYTIMYLVDYKELMRGHAKLSNLQRLCTLSLRAWTFEPTIKDRSCRLSLPPYMRANKSCSEALNVRYNEVKCVQRCSILS